ncbi:T9SS type A sorting domain-containing protein [bacterium]|nr:T9SS type A sorting domain-containing protein [bacterium]
MKRMVAVVLFCAAFAGLLPVQAQVSINQGNVPMTPGDTFEYLSESDVTVDLGNPGANQVWDFTQTTAPSVQTEEIVNPADSPYYTLFPNANRVTFGPIPFGLSDGTAWRYDEVTADQWTVTGIATYIEELGGDFPLPLNVPLMPLPLNYGDDWTLDLYREITIDVDDIPYPIPVFEEIRIEITIGGSNDCDGWGTVLVPGGEIDALRVYSLVGGYADAIGIYYLFGTIPIEVPIGRVFELPASHAYSWYAPDYGEVAFAASQTGEPDPNFTDASVMRRLNLGETPATLTLDAEPLNAPVEIPAQGGTFNWSLAIQSTYTTNLTGNIWTTATLPNGNEYFVQNVPVNLPPNADIFVPNMSQAVPGMAPAGTYSFNVYGGLYPNVVLGQDSFGFSKLVAGTDAAWTPDWSANGLDQLTDRGLASEDTSPASPREFTLGVAYPNPFNPTTTLSLTLPQAARVDVVVFDALGRQVATVAQGTYAAGQHDLTVDGRGLASGVYFVHASVPGQLNQVQKIVLMK